MCLINDLSKANWRTIDSLFGNYACHHKPGSGVIDYLLTPYPNLCNMTDFKIGEHHLLPSDHCPTEAKLRLYRNSKAGNKMFQWTLCLTVLSGMMAAQ